MFCRIILSVFLLLAFNEVSCRECSDCQIYTSCGPALNLASTKKDETTKQKFQQAFCGFEGKENIVKVCCSDFETKVLMNRLAEDDEDLTAKLKLLPQECGDIVGYRIVGGQVAKIYEFPWMTLISYSTRFGLKFKCSGTIINKRYILTAAHCVQNETIAGVRVGEFDVRYQTDCQGEQEDLVCEDHVQDIGVDNKIVHEDYVTSPAVKNDIALLRLSEDIEFGHKNVKPVCLPVLPELRNKDISGELATVTGWGLTESGRESSVLLKVLVPIKSDATCRSYYNRQVAPGVDRTENQICAGDLNKDSCNGDSGGPLVLEDRYNRIDRFVQYGVVSHGPRRCGSNFPGVYTDVRKFVDWILKNIEP